jgi:hypothetical protein
VGKKRARTEEVEGTEDEDEGEGEGEEVEGVEDPARGQCSRCDERGWTCTWKGRGKSCIACRESHAGCDAAERVGAGKGKAKAKVAPRKKKAKVEESAGGASAESEEHMSDWRTMAWAAEQSAIVQSKMATLLEYYISEHREWRQQASYALWKVGETLAERLGEKQGSAGVTYGEKWVQTGFEADVGVQTEEGRTAETTETGEGEKEGAEEGSGDGNGEGSQTLE